METCGEESASENKPDICLGTKGVIFWHLYAVSFVSTKFSKDLRDTLNDVGRWTSEHVRTVNSPIILS